MNGMRSFQPWTFSIAVGLAMAVLLVCPLAASTQETEREQIGEVLGIPVYLDQLSDAQGDALTLELHDLFSHPVMQRYRARHRRDLIASEHEVAIAAAHFDGWHRDRLKGLAPLLHTRRKKIDELLAAPDVSADEQRELRAERRRLDTRLTPPGRKFARWMVTNWKLQHHIYTTYGRGRVLWQDAGLEAFDAMRVWLEARERAGDFRIADPALRERLYAYWTSVDHGDALSGDADFIRHEFLDPYWLRPLPAKQ